MTITINTEQINSNLKTITSASVDDYANAIHSVAKVIGTVIAFILAVVETARAAYKHPLAALDQWTTPNPVAVAAPVKERPTKAIPKPRPAVPAASAIEDKPETAKPKRTTRARKKRTLATA